MKVITLWQPWATLIACGAKRIETRGWPTSYRGLLAIHAGKRYQRDAVDWDASFDSHRLIDRHRGKIVAVARLADVVQTERVRALPQLYCGDLSRLARELEFGDFGAGRFAWILRDVTPLLRLIDHRGGQGLRNLPEAIAQAVSEEAVASIRQRLVSARGRTCTPSGFHGGGENWPTAHGGTQYAS